MAVPFDNTGKCNGEGSQPCLTCGRYTLKPGAPVKGQVYVSEPVRSGDGRLIGGGFRDCKDWMPHDLNAALNRRAGVSLAAPLLVGDGCQTSSAGGGLVA